MLKSLGKLSCLLSCLILDCSNPVANKDEALKKFKEGSFGFDNQFLEKFDSIIVLKNNDGQSRVIVSPKYQGKVFTSTAEGDEGRSFGWINYKAFTAQLDEHMNAFGGENRFWLGPEGGAYSLFFPKDSSMKFENWKTPTPIDTEAWDLVYKNEDSVQLQKEIVLKNYSGSTLSLQVDRSISLLTGKEIEMLIELPLESSMHIVGYRTKNVITNKSKYAWNEQTGVPCIWILDMFTPSPQTTIIIPYVDNNATPKKVATTNYFGEIPAERIKIKNGLLLFKADGKKRGKLGINPYHARNVAGSFDALANILTITFFDIDNKGRYLNQEWNTTKPPFSGDAVNAYNDGPLEKGGQLGPFYEIESVSPAAFLKPGESLSHQHVVLHFTGSKEGLDVVARKMLGTTLAEVETAFGKN